LAFTPNTKEDDYKLYASDLYDMKLNTDLAVLSACDTGVGELQKGEGIMSLSRAFTYAGCPSLVMSLWSIPEKSSSELLRTFFEKLKKNVPKNIALQKAKLDYLETANHNVSHPNNWAGLVLTGNTEALNFKNDSNVFRWILALLLMLGSIFLVTKYLKIS